ncbi:hypothetical protein L6452_01051 [Arctium lappa]|uniref:Uncharacterized protein n=1 Tax=Arctium lappa TaxID=4217 RepID=A0ACB9FFK6_ARCLA|nr:hypothetical protein L6452_01051 [Arctium lappa]
MGCFQSKTANVQSPDQVPESKPDLANGDEGSDHGVPAFKEFELTELQAATNGISSELIISENRERAPNVVYRGKLCFLFSQLESCFMCIENLQANSNFPVSQHPTVDGKFTSTTFCSATVESCSVVGGDKSLQTSTYMIEAEGSKTSFEEEVETEACQEGKHPIMGEFHLELDDESDLKHNEVSIVLT